MLPVTVVIATRDRWSTLERTLQHLSELPERPPIIVVDNDSGDRTPALVRHCYPHATVVALPANVGAAARTVGSRLATTPFVAFADDDSWWDEGALPRAAALLSADAGVGLIAARVLVGEAAVVDPTSALMEVGALDERYRLCPDGRRGVTGFLACGAIVRRWPFLAVGGFHPYFLIGGEEELVALDLAHAGWKLVYSPEVVARHHPSTARDTRLRQRLTSRNALLTSWLRYSPGGSLRRGMTALRAGGRRQGSLGLADAAALAPWAFAQRSPVRGDVEQAFLRDDRPRAS